MNAWWQRLHGGPPGPLDGLDAVSIRAVNLLLLAIGRERSAWLAVTSGASCELTISRGGELRTYADVAAVLAVALPEGDPQRDERPDDLFELMANRLERMAGLFALGPTAIARGTLQVVVSDDDAPPGARREALFSLARTGDGATRTVVVETTEPFPPAPSGASTPAG